MTTADDAFARARRIADAILYEGYVLYPYRASSRKNRYRWTFGVLAPRSWSAHGGCERSSLRVECLVEAGERPPRVDGRLRFLQVERRTVETAGAEDSFVAVDRLEHDGEELISWEEGHEREVSFTVELAGGKPTRVEAHLSGTDEQRLLQRDGRIVGRVVRTQQPLALTVLATAETISERLVKLEVAVENVTRFDDLAAPRVEAVASSLVGAHLLLSVAGGAFVSQLDPPEWAEGVARALRSDGVYPVLAGEPGTRELVLASPIVLYDHPQIAPESPGDSFDGTEVDELLALSTLSLTDAEKREARATDARAAAVIDRAESLSAEAMLGLHGRTQTATSEFAPGCRVRIRLGAPTGTHRTDAQDMFLEGRTGTVEEVRQDFEGRTYLALVLDDDPGADLHRWYGRHLHFSPEEVELVESAP